MALAPKFKTHRLIFTEPSATSPSSEPLHTLEFYLDYVCPFSAKLFKTLTTHVIPYIQSRPDLSSRLQLIFRHQIQPWHPSSTLVHEAALAAARLLSASSSSPSSAFWTALSATLFARQAAFFDEAAAHESRNQTYRRLAALISENVRDGEVRADELYGLLAIREEKEKGEGEGEGGRGVGTAGNEGNAVTADVKAVVKLARQVGVHVSPTVLFDGVVAGEISSGWTGQQWEEWLGKNVV